MIVPLTNNEIEKLHRKICDLEIAYGQSRSLRLKLQLALSHVLKLGKDKPIPQEVIEDMQARFCSVHQPDDGSLPKLELVVDNGSAA